MTDIKERRDDGTPEWRKRNSGNIQRVATGPGTSALKIREQVPIDRMVARGQINDEQYEAAEEFYRLWWFGAQKSHYATMRLDDTPRGQSSPESQYDIAFKYQKAQKAIRSVYHQLVILNIVCLQETPKYLNHNPAELMLRLREGLDDLALHFQQRRRNK